MTGGTSIVQIEKRGFGSDDDVKNVGGDPEMETKRGRKISTTKPLGLNGKRVT